MRYDVWKFFEECGVKKAPGAEAIYLGDAAVVIVTASSEMHGLIERILGGCGGCGYPVKFAEISASLWEYEDDQFAEAAPGRHHFADLRQRAGSSLKLIDSQSIVTKSGQRATAFSKQADTARAPVAASVAKPAGAAPGDNASRTGLNGARGSLLEVEPTIGPDGETVDMAINYEARFKRTGGEQDVEVNVQTNLTLMSNQDTIPYCALAHDDGLPAQQGKLKRRALVVVARVIDADGRTVEEREKQRVQKEEQLIRRARAGLDAPGK